MTPYITPNNFPGTLDANQKMLLEIKALADDAESPSVCIEISWDGKWEDDSRKMAEHLVVKEVKCR